MRGRGENWGEGKRRALVGIIRSVRCRIWWWGSQGCWAVWVGKVECYVTALGDLQAHLPGWEMRSTQWLSRRLCSLSRGIWIPGQWCLLWSHLFSFSSDHCWCHCSTGVFSPWWVHLPWWIPQYCQSGPHQSWACISYPSSGVRQPLGCARLSWGIRDHSQVKSWRRRFACNYQQAILKRFWLKIKWVALAKSVCPSHWDILCLFFGPLSQPLGLFISVSRGLWNATSGTFFTYGKPPFHLSPACQVLYFQIFDTIQLLYCKEQLVSCFCWAWRIFFGQNISFNTSIHLMRFVSASKIHPWWPFSLSVSCWQPCGLDYLFEIQACKECFYPLRWHELNIPLEFTYA